MLSVVLNKILKKIHSQDSNCEKEQDRMLTGVEGKTVDKQRAHQSISSMGPGGDRKKTEKPGGIPDPWFS
jgi:hypothetical protein